MPETKTVKRDFSRIGMALFVISIVSTVLQLVFTVIWTIFTVNKPIATAEWAMWLLTFAPIYLIAVPMGLAIMRPVSADKQPGVKLGGKRFWMLMLMCIAVMYIGNIIGTVLSAVLSGGTAENALLTMIDGSPLFTFLFAVLIAPVIEEYIFRKQIIDRLGKYGEKTAILLSALTFGLFHMNLFQFFYAFGLGVLFAYVYIRTRSLRYPVFMHMIINFQGSILAPWVLTKLDIEALERMASGDFDISLLPSMLPGLLIYMVYFTLLMVCVVAGLVLLIKSWKKREITSDAEEPAVKTVWCNAGMILFTVFCLLMSLFALFSGLLVA